MDGIDINSREHEELRELCAASVSERLSPEEEKRLSAHLAVCSDCRTKLGQYRAIERFGLPMAAFEDLKDEELARVQHDQQQKALNRLMDACGMEAAQVPIREEFLRAEEGIVLKRGHTFKPAFGALLRYAAGIDRKSVV